MKNRRDGIFKTTLVKNGRNIYASQNYCRPSFSACVQFFETCKLKIGRTGSRRGGAFGRDIDHETAIFNCGHGCHHRFS